MENKSKKEILTEALEAREKEVFHYQLNIDTYSLAIQNISLLPPSEKLELNGFLEQLTSLLQSEKLEQKKAKVMLNVLKQQLEE